MITRFATILLLTGLLLNLPYFGQLVKIPLLFEHYQEHRLLNRDLSFTDFLLVHYSKAPAHDSRDNSLPFKSTVRLHHTGIQLSAPPAPFVLAVMEIALSGDIKVPLNYFHLPAGPISNIFKPPRA